MRSRGPCRAVASAKAGRHHFATRNCNFAFQEAFTLLELLVVIGIIAILMVAVVPAFTTMKGGNDITSAAYSIASVLEQARNYAMSNNTYVWVGFYEEDATAGTPTNAVPPYPGKGRLLMATVCSTDGTKIFDDSDPVAPIPVTRIKQIAKLTRIEGVHLTDIGAPPTSAPGSDSLDGRPITPYTEGSPFDHFNRISSDTSDTTRFSFIAQNYTFYKTVRFSPRGEANVNSTYTMKHAAEIALKPTHGTSIDTKSTNLVAIQFGGVGGNFKIYRK